VDIPQKLDRIAAPAKTSKVRPAPRDRIADTTTQGLALKLLFEANIDDGATGELLQQFLTLRLQVVAPGDARR
jgi:hypothetical protein